MAEGVFIPSLSSLPNPLGPNPLPLRKRDASFSEFNIEENGVFFFSGATVNNALDKLPFPVVASAKFLPNISE